MITKKVTQYRILHYFNQDGKLADQHIYYPQCKVLFFRHTIGQAKANRVAIEQILLHENEQRT